MRGALKYVSLFSGAGGLDIGLERVGLHAVSLNEIDSDFCDTLRVNGGSERIGGRKYFGQAAVHNADVRELSAADVSLGQEIDLVVGGPPCQAFSSSGKQLSVLDPRGALVQEFYRLIDGVRPRMFLFENVRGVVTARGKSGEPGEVIRGLLQSFGEIGYSCRAGLLNSADYGSYQRRVRCFIVGSRAGKAPLFPRPIHANKRGDLFLKPWRTLGEFLDLHEDGDSSGYTFPTESLGSQLSVLPDGSGLKSMGRKEPTRPGGHWGYRQGTFIADQAKPARTVTGSTSQDWIRRSGLIRRLTLKEVQVLQGFPGDWLFMGTKAKRYKQVGNAVPSVFGEVLGREIVHFLSEFPQGAPVPVPLPDSFKDYIAYTKRDHARNAEARTVHLPFSGGNQASEVDT